MDVSDAASSDNRFPGQLFQLETGLAYNWHRHYDSTIGRYKQVNPLGLVSPMTLPNVWRLKSEPRQQNPNSGKENAEAIQYTLARKISDDSGEASVPVLKPGVHKGGPSRYNYARQRPATDIDPSGLITPGTVNPGSPGQAQCVSSDCAEEWKWAYSHCALLPAFGGFPDLYSCARGYVSQRCGGNPVQWTPGRKRR